METTDRTSSRGRRLQPKHSNPALWEIGGERKFVLNRVETLIGRDEDADIRLLDKGISRKHAKIVQTRDGLFMLFDLQSTNGMFVNGQKVDMAALREGFRVALGHETEFEFSHQRPHRSGCHNPAEVLTRRELEIARLVARGLTNREIGDHLEIRPRTVSTHLDNIYNRLGIGSRAELTRSVVEAGLQETR